MAKKEHPLSALEKFLPPNTLDFVLEYFKKYSIWLTLTKERKTILGDYRPPANEKAIHKISINGDLNPYHFLITLLHEIAHLEVYLFHKNKVAPHGQEWKTTFSQILKPFLQAKVFPEDISEALQGYLKNPGASSCSDPKLYRALYKYDIKKNCAVLVEQLSIGQKFKSSDGRLFQKLSNLRTRSKCEEISTKKLYFFHGIAEVYLVE